PLPRGGPLRVRRLYSDRMMLVSGPRRGLAQWRPCELARVPNLRLIVQSPLHGTRGLIDDFLRSANIAVHQLLEIDGIAGMLNLVRATTWSALLPFIAVARTLP